MGDDEVSRSIKKTQEQLGRFVKKPPLSDKNLSRPPFRFLHDVVHNVIDTTGFMSGVFTPEELDAGNVTSRDAKAAFVQKVIQAIKEKTGEEIPIKISKVLAGLEPEKTNALLQALAKSIEVHQQDGGGTGSSPTKKTSGGTKKSPYGTTSKTGKSTKPDPKKVGGKSTDKKDGGSGIKRGVRDPSPGQSKPATKQGKLGEKTPDNSAPSSGTKAKSVSRAEAKKPLIPEQPPPESLITDEINPPVEEESPPPRALTASKRSDSLTRKESSMDLSGGGGGDSSLPDEMDLDNNGGVDDGDDDIQNNNESHELYDNFASLVKPNMQTLPPPKTPILTDADAVNATMSLPGELAAPKSPQTPIRSPMTLGTPSPGHSLTPTATPSPISQIAGIGPMKAPPLLPSSATSQQGRSLSRELSAENKGLQGSATIGEVRPPTGQARSRPDTGTAAGRMSSARPPSARRAPPRPKSSAMKEDVEPYRPTTGKVAHVIMDSTEDPDDDNYVVREVTVTASKAPGLSDLDETPELTLSNGIGTGEQLDALLPPDQRGLLVNQILETQKELEDKKEGGEAPVIEKKLKELSLAEIEKLKNLIQLCARSANPLAKLLDYMAEDVDSMQKEYNNYREESKRLSMELENAKLGTDKFLQSLKHELHEIERKVKDKEDAILTSQMKIIQQEERIEEIVNGFERVRSGKSAQVEQHMPQSDEIMAHIQGQSSYSSSGGMGPSTFTFSVGSPSENNNFGRSAVFPSSSGGAGGIPESFKIPDSFMVNNAGGGNNPGVELSSPFSRGRMWSSTTNNSNNSGRGSFERINSEDDQPSLSSSTATGFSMQRNIGRSVGGMGAGATGNNNNSFRRSTTTGATEFQLDMDADSFNPWS